MKQKGFIRASPSRILLIRHKRSLRDSIIQEWVTRPLSGGSKLFSFLPLLQGQQTRCWCMCKVVPVFAAKPAAKCLIGLSAVVTSRPPISLNVVNVFLRTKKQNISYEVKRFCLSDSCILRWPFPSVLWVYCPVTCSSITNKWLTSVSLGRLILVTTV